MPRSIPKPTQAGLILRIALLQASSRGEIDSPDTIIDLLADAVEEIEASALEAMEGLQAALTAEREAREADREAYPAQRARWEAERAAHVRLRERLQRDAAAITGTSQPGPLEDPHGYYVYFLWDHSNRLLYVGQSTNVLLRLGQHVSQYGIAIYRITTVECPDEGTMKRMEARAIAEHKPQCNVHGASA